MRCVRHQRSRCWARTVLVWARCISGDLPFCVGREVSGGVWPLLCAGTSPHHFCAGLRLRSGPSLTTRGRHTQRHMGSRVGDRPRLRWAHDLRLLGPYFALGRALATFALGSDSAAGRPLLRGAATLQGSSVPHGHETVSGTGHVCAGHMVSDCSPLSRWGQTLQQAGPYYAGPPHSTARLSHMGTKPCQRPGTFALGT